jgi:hypothetical protein
VVIKGNQQSRISIDAATMSRLAEGQTALIVQTGDAAARLTLVRATRTTGPGRPALLFAELDTAYLWPAVDASNSEEKYCIVDARNHPLFCDAGLAASLVAPKSESSTSTPEQAIRQSRTGNDQLVGKSRLSIAEHYGVPDWIVLASQPRSTAVAATHRAALIYMAAGMLVVIVSLALAMVLTRWRTGSGTEKIDRSQARLATPPPKHTSSDATRGLDSVQAHDNPDDSERLSIAMRVLANIDRAILSGATFERIVDSFVDSVRGALPAEVIAVALLDHDRPTRTRLIITGPDIEREECSIEGALDLNSIAHLSVTPDGEWLNCMPRSPLIE